MNLNEAKQILKNAGYLIEDFEEDVARKFFDTNFPFAKIEHGRLMLYRPEFIEINIP